MKRSRWSNSSFTTRRTKLPTTGHPSRAPLRNTQWYNRAATSISANEASIKASSSLAPVR